MEFNIGFESLLFVGFCIFIASCAGIWEVRRKRRPSSGDPNGQSIDNESGGQEKAKGIAPLWH